MIYEDGRSIGFDDYGNEYTVPSEKGDYMKWYNAL